MRTDREVLLDAVLDGHRRLVAVCEDARRDERARLARELHDGVGQLLTSAALLARSLEARDDGASGASVAALREVVEAALAETRTVVWRRRPTAVQDLGFEGALEALAETFRRCHGVGVDVHVAAVDGLSPPVAAAGYRVAQEAMTNAVKHAAPTVLSVVAWQRGPTFTLVVEDDGTGFDPSALVGDGGMGTRGMGERAAALGGRVDVESRLGHGTTVRLVVPCGQGPRR